MCEKVLRRYHTNIAKASMIAMIDMLCLVLALRAHNFHNTRLSELARYEIAIVVRPQMVTERIFVDITFDLKS